MSHLSKIVILTTRGGEGLVSGSIAIKESIEEFHPSTEVVIVDFFSKKGSTIGALLTSIYNLLLRRSILINACYIRLIHFLRIDRWKIFFGSSLRSFQHIIETHEPDVIIITSQYIVASVCHAREKLRKQIPLVVANIDPGSSCVPLWFDPRIDLHLIPTTEAMDAYRRHSIPPEKAKLVKLMVKKRFTDISSSSREVLRTELGFTPHIPLVLFTGSREGYDGMLNLALRTLDETHSQVAVVCGTNKKLRNKLSELTGKYGARVQVIGWCEDIERLMRASDLIISKPGKQTMKESLAVGTPLLTLAYPVVMQQEIGNIELLRNHNILLEAKSEDQLIRKIAQLLSDTYWLTTFQNEVSDRGKELICRSAVPDAISSSFNKHQKCEPANSTAHSINPLEYEYV